MEIAPTQMEVFTSCLWLNQIVALRCLSVSGANLYLQAESIKQEVGFEVVMPKPRKGETKGTAEE